MKKLKLTTSHNGDYAANSKQNTQIDPPRLWALVCIPTGLVLGVDILKSRVDALLRIVPFDLRNNYVVWRYDPHDYKKGY